MADRSNLLSVKKKNVEKKVEDKDKEKEKSLKKSKKPVNKTPQQEEKTVAGGQPDDAAAAATAAAGEAAEGANAEGNGDYQPIELPPFEIVSGSVTIVLCISITHTHTEETHLFQILNVKAIILFVLRPRTLIRY